MLLISYESDKDFLAVASKSHFLFINFKFFVKVKMKKTCMSKQTLTICLVKMIILVLILIPFFGCANEGLKGLSGNKSKLTSDNFLKIQVGMNHQDVKLILGSPTSESGSTDIGIRNLIWIEGNKEISVSIDNNGNVMPFTTGGSAAKIQRGLN